jgi:acyl-coenzyme A thioesterase PaaI-like protein
LFSAGALVQLADIAATWLSHLHLRAGQAPEGSFAFAVHLSANLVGSTDQGDALARARITSAGRTLIVTQTEVTDDSGRLLVLQTATHVVRTPR